MGKWISTLGLMGWVHVKKCIWLFSLFTSSQELFHNSQLINNCVKLSRYNNRLMTEKYYQSSLNFPTMLCSWKSSVVTHFLEWNLVTCWKLKKQLLGMLLDLSFLSLNKDWITCFLEGIRCCLFFLVTSCILFIWHRLQTAFVPSLSNIPWWET